MDSLYHFLTTHHAEESHTLSGGHPLVVAMVLALTETAFAHGTVGQVILIAAPPILDQVRPLQQSNHTALEYCPHSIPLQEQEAVLVIYTTNMATVLCATRTETGSNYQIAWSFDPAVVRHVLTEWLPTTSYRIETTPLLATITPTLDYRVLHVILNKWQESGQQATGFQTVEGLGWDILYLFEYDDSPQGGVFQVRYARPDTRLGYTLQQLNEVGWQKTVHPDDLQMLLATTERSLNGEIIEITYRVVSPNGTITWIHHLSRPEADPFTQKVVRSYGYMRDVTERKEAEQRLQASEARYRDIFENSPAMYVILQEHGGVPAVVDCNTRFLQVLGYERNEVIGQPSSKFYADPMHRLYDIGGYQYAAEYGYIEGEKELRTKSGTILATRVDGAAFFDTEGHFAGVRIAMISIADLKNAEQKLQLANAELEQRVQERTASLARANRQLNAQIHQMQKVEGELRDSRNRLLYFYENASDLIQILQSDGKISYVNQAWQKTMGYTAQEVIGKSILEFLDPAAIATQRSEYHNHKDQGMTDDGTETTIVAKDGKRIDVEVSVTLQIEKGQPKQSLYVMRDVTTKRAVERERVAVQTELLENRNRLLQLYENANDLIHIVTYADTAQISYVNRKWLTTLGYTAEEVIGLPVLNFYPQEEHRPLIQTFLAFAKTRTEHWTLDSVLVTSDGRRIEVEASFSVRYHSDGTPDETLAILRDVTAQREVKREQDIIEARYRNIVQSLPNTSIILFDTDLRYILVDGMDLEPYGFSREQLVGQRYVDLAKMVAWDSTQPDHLLKAHIAALQGHSTILDFPFAGRMIRVQLNPLQSEGIITGGMLIATDITPEHQREQQLREAKETAEAATQTKNFFLANMSHEIRTPLNGIVGFTRLLAETTLSPEQKEFVSVIVRSSDTLLNLLSDILDFSKIEAERLDISAEPFHICDMLMEVEQVYALQAYAKGLDFDTEIDFDVPENLIGDSSRIRQILMNLFSNALKFTTQGSILLQVNGNATEDSQYMLSLTVKDTGIGINPDQQHLIFETFTQADSTMTRRYGGAGLGLAICKRLSELMGGTITVSSEPGQGATFVVTVRCGVVPHLPNRFPHTLDPQLEGKRLLLVMPATNGAILERAAHHWGMIPTHFDSSGSAISIDSQSRFDVAVFEQAVGSGANNELFYTLITEVQNRGVRTLVITRGTSEPQWNPEETGVLVISKPAHPARLYKAIINTLTGTPLAISAPIATSRLNANFALEFPLRILLAEDNAVNQQVILAILRRLGYTPDLARDGKEAWKAVQNMVYDIILMDIQMPFLSGMEATEQIRALRTKIHQPRIIALTANVLAGQKESYLAVGMNDYLSKPLNIDALLAVLAKTAEEKPLLQATKGFNPLALAELRDALGEEGDDMVKQVVSIYFEELAERLLRIQVGRTVARWEEVSHAAHALKGSSSTVGAYAIAATCAEMEAAVKADTTALIPGLVNRLVIEVAEIKEALKPLTD